MLQSRIKGVLHFAAFVLPALFLYGLFFLCPFGQGIRISFTNWDGLTPRTPISMPKREFEEKILDRAGGAREREFLLGIHRLDASDNLCKRSSISGAARYRLRQTLRKTGCQPDTSDRLL